MSDVEWYLESAGVRRGPFSARQIIEMMRSGEVARDALVTTARMQGDWVTVQDLSEAYSELHQKKAVAQPASDNDPTRGHITYSTGRDQYQAPPRPIQQLEASKLIVLQQEPEADATDSLFAAVQTIRDKKQGKSVGHAHRERGSDSARSVDTPRIPQQTVLYIALFVLVGIGVYGASRVYKGSEEAAATTPAPDQLAPVTAANPPPAPVPAGQRAPVGTAPAMSGNRLLSDGGRVNNSAPSRPRVESYRRREPEPDRELERERELERDRERERERDRDRMREREREPELNREPPEPEHMGEGDQGPEQPPDGETEPNPPGMEAGEGETPNDSPRRKRPVEEVAPEELAN